ncbi:MAG: tRNA pseudouridine(55) synthase TruB [Dehalococcoidia bacterium]
MRGFLNIDKPEGATSFDVVRAVRRATHVKRVGHAGTLDPLATGVLPVAVGEATRLIDALMDASKAYVVEIAFGAETTTDDAAGDVIARADAASLTEREVRDALAQFVGRGLQTPPAFSALKLDGVPAYRAARQGAPREMQPREVVAHALMLRTFEAARATVEVECGKGYYVRALARDLGRALGVYGHVAALRRTRVGPFRIERAAPLGDAARRLEAGDIEGLFHAPDAVLVDWPAVILDAREVSDARLGREVAPEPLSGRIPAVSTKARAYTPQGLFVAQVEAVEGGRWHPYRVFAADT